MKTSGRTLMNAGNAGGIRTEVSRSSQAALRTGSQAEAAEREDYMKKQIIPGFVVLFLALVVSIGSVSFLGPCVHDDGSVGACHWAGRSLFGLGLLLTILSLLAVLLRKARFGLYLGIALACVLGILTPGALISLCKMSSMRCRAVMQPAMIILFAAAGLCAVCGIIACVREKKGRA